VKGGGQGGGRHGFELAGRWNGEHTFIFEKKKSPMRGSEIVNCADSPEKRRKESKSKGVGSVGWKCAFDCAPALQTNVRSRDPGKGGGEQKEWITKFEGAWAGT